MTKPNQATYDAKRIINGRFAGAVQEKASGSRSAVEKAISQMEKTKPGSAARGTLRVPKDEVERAATHARGRIRVSGMGFTTEQRGASLTAA